MRPVTVHEVEAVVHAKEPGDEVTVYEVISPPPLEVGANQVTTTDDEPDIPATDRGALGVVAGVIEEVGLADIPEPFLLMATTEKVYAVPFVRPQTMHVSAPLVLQVAPPGLAVTR